MSHIASWCAGVLGLAFVIWYFQLAEFGRQIARIGFAGGLAWLLLTLMARCCLVEVTVRPVQALGFRLSRIDAFWIGWIRTFANQIVPLSGLAFFTAEIRRKAKVPWSGMLALSTPLFLFAAAALGVVGTAGTIAGWDYLGPSSVPMLVAFTLLGGGAIIAATHAGWVLDKLPGTRFLFVRESADAFRQLASCRLLVTQVIGFHVLAMLLRGVRLWLLFRIAGAEIDVAGALLLIVIVEGVGLLQVTPGGLGLREGAIIGGAVLLGTPAETGALVALIDRLFLIVLTALLALPGYLLLRRC